MASTALWTAPQARDEHTILILGMLLMWGVSGLLSRGLLGVSFWAAMPIGAIVTPTDPPIFVFFGRALP